MKRQEQPMEYLHGFGSSFDPLSTKIQTLKSLGDVTGSDYDYSEPFNRVLDSMIRSVSQRQPDLLVGTSLGGFYAAALSSRLGIPFVAINPSIDPRRSLARYEGQGTSWTGAAYHLTRAVIDGYPEYSLDANHGLILLDRGDEICDAEMTEQFLGPYYQIISYAGGHHRFAHMEDSLAAIKLFARNAGTTINKETE